MPARIVVVLDDPALANLAVAGLAALGHEAVAIEDPMDALRALETAVRIEALVTSANFPPGKPNGVSLARMTRMRRPELKVLFLVPPDIIEVVSRDGQCLPTPATAAEIASTAAEMMQPTGR